MYVRQTHVIESDRSAVSTKFSQSICTSFTVTVVSWWLVHMCATFFIYKNVGKFFYKKTFIM